MTKKYYSVDVELSGMKVGKNSIVSIGACVIGNKDIQFYEELKPISPHYEKMSLRIAASGLECLTPELKRLSAYNPDSRHFRPEFIMRLLARKGRDVGETMNEFVSWIDSTRGIDEPVIVGKSVNIDSSFIYWYLRNFVGEISPFSEEGILDLRDYIRKITGRKDASLKSLNVPDSRGKVHNALDDCIYTAEQFEEITEMQNFMREEKQCI